MKFLNKQKLREYVWKKLENEKVVDFPIPCYGRIPNFTNSIKASERVKELEEFRKAKCIFSAPDWVLRRIREIVLEENKILAIALPNMTEFLQISNPSNIKDAVKIKGFKKYGKPLREKVELFIQGSVAVDLKGNRLGKGKGYGDKEWEWLHKNNLITQDCKIITLVHKLQVFDDFSYLMEEKDKKVDYIITLKEIIPIYGSRAKKIR